MRKEPFFEGDIVHIFNRGNRRQEIVRDDKDRIRFLQMLYYFNHTNIPPNPMRSLRKLLKSDFNSFNVAQEWPRQWGERDPLTEVLAFVLMDNHYHLLLRETQEGGITSFMRRLGVGMTNRFNTRYDEVGSLFQGAYKARRVDKDTYLQYLTVYLHVKNIFELFPGGLSAAIDRFDEAFEFAAEYPYSSLGGYLLGEHISSPITQKDILKDIISDREDFKEFARASIPFMEFDYKSSTLSVEI